MLSSRHFFGAGIVILLPLALGAGPAAADSLNEASALLASGEYAAAEKTFRALGRPTGAAPGDRAEARLGMARVLLETGRFYEAAKTARAAAQGPLRARALTLAGEALLSAGKVAEAQAALSQALAKAPDHYRARIYLGLALRAQGKAAEARAAFEALYDAFDAGAIDTRSAEQLTYVGMACRYTDNFRDASDTFRDAVDADPKHLEAWVQWAEISLEKYEAGYAEKHYAAALKVNPHHARALSGLARVKLEQSNHVDDAVELLDAAERTAPGYPAAKVVRARIAIDAEQHAQAQREAKDALKTNPRHLGALSMLAASYFIDDDRAAFLRTKAKVLKLNPAYSAFFQEVVEIGMRHHRYADCLTLSQEAVKRDPRDWVSLSQLGTNYLRLGEDEKGLAALREAWKGDPFNVRTYNLLNLYEDVLAKEYTFIRSPHFKLRVHTDERVLLERTVVPVLERAFVTYAKKYRYAPKEPIIVELYQNPEHYAVRTVGLPGLAALGVCFGRVITAISPTNGRFNWGQVLWHELNHAFTIQMSRSRVPRWLTEGMADLEPMLERPEWKRENDFDIYQGLSSGRLRGLATMNMAFTRAKSIDEIVVAYYQGSLMVRFLIDHFGLPKVLAAIKQYGTGKKTPEIFRTVTGLELEELDRRFVTAEKKRLAHYQKSWFFDDAAYRDLDALKARAQAAPKDAAALAALAAGYLVRGDAGKAATQAHLALGLARTDKTALFVAAQTALAQKQTAAARRHLEALVASGGDGFQARMLLGRLALADKDLDGARAHLERAKALDPEAAEPYALLARAYEKQKKRDLAVAELKRLAQLDQQSLQTVTLLVRHLQRQGDWAGVRQYGRMAYFIQPGSVELHKLMARAYTEAAPRPVLDRAVWHLETALASQPERPAEVQVALARVHLKRNDRRAAKAAIRAAIKADPKDGEVVKMKKELGL